MSDLQILIFVIDVHHLRIERKVDDGLLCMTISGHARKGLECIYYNIEVPNF